MQTSYLEACFICARQSLPSGTALCFSRYPHCPPAVCPLCLCLFSDPRTPPLLIAESLWPELSPRALANLPLRQVVGAPPRLFSHPPVVPNHSVEPDMARPSTRALPCSGSRPMATQLHHGGSGPFNFFPKLNGQIKSRALGWLGLLIFFLCVNFAKKLIGQDGICRCHPGTPWVPEQLLLTRAALPLPSYIFAPLLHHPNPIPLGD